MECTQENIMKILPIFFISNSNRVRRTYILTCVWIDDFTVSCYIPFDDGDNDVHRHLLGKHFQRCAQNSNGNPVNLFDKSATKRKLLRKSRRCHRAPPHFQRLHLHLSFSNAFNNFVSFRLTVWRNRGNFHTCIYFSTIIRFRMYYYDYVW